ncbi:hypothetical protein DFH08DRAFT_931919 [Mycena albidolilacea]|uniref:Uncharacterized protein n=1 Tax=Mycena albidolilacea TaxID=1033008 RepID=A0AAD7AHW5_9AGAR|nr:hypothetical protein DFH08DRAFT_931919 [Mycena albidolilacea]
MDWTACVLRLYQPEFDPRVSTRGKDPSHVPINATRLEWTSADFGKVRTLIAIASFKPIARHREATEPRVILMVPLSPHSYRLQITNFKAPAPRIQPQQRRPVRRCCLIPFGGIFSSIRLWSHRKFGKQDKMIIVSINAFIYPGFVAAGKEIEQPFERLVDLNMFCQVIITQDIKSLHSVLCLNAYLELIRHCSMTLTEAAAHNEFKDISDEEVHTDFEANQWKNQESQQLRKGALVSRLYGQERENCKKNGNPHYIMTRQNFSTDRSNLLSRYSIFRMVSGADIRKLPVVEGELGYLASTCLHICFKTTKISNNRSQEIVGGSILPNPNTATHSPAFDSLQATHPRQPSSRHCSTTMVQTPWCAPGQLVEVEKGQGDRGRG